MRRSLIRAIFPVVAVVAVVAVWIRLGEDPFNPVTLKKWASTSAVECVRACVCLWLRLRDLL